MFPLQCSGYGLLNIVLLCSAYYVVPFPRMEFYHFVFSEQSAKCMCMSITTYSSLCICFTQGCSSNINGNYVWGISQSSKSSHGYGVDPGGDFFFSQQTLLVEKLTGEGPEVQF